MYNLLVLIGRVGIMGWVLTNYNDVVFFFFQAEDGIRDRDG